MLIQFLFLENKKTIAWGCEVADLNAFVLGFQAICTKRLQVKHQKIKEVGLQGLSATDGTVEKMLLQKTVCYLNIELLAVKYHPYLPSRIGPQYFDIWIRIHYIDIPFYVS